MSSTLKKKIMRNVYYTYALRRLWQPVLFHGFALFVLMLLLTSYVSIGNVLQNMMHVGIGELGTFLVNAVTNTEAWTLFIIGLCIFFALSLRFSLSPARVHRVA